MKSNNEEFYETKNPLLIENSRLSSHLKKVQLTSQIHFENRIENQEKLDETIQDIKKTESILKNKINDLEKENCKNSIKKIKSQRTPSSSSNLTLLDGDVNNNYNISRFPINKISHIFQIRTNSENNAKEILSPKNELPFKGENESNEKFNNLKRKLNEESQKNNDLQEIIKSQGQQINHLNMKISELQNKLENQNPLKIIPSKLHLHIRGTAQKQNSSDNKSICDSTNNSRQNYLFHIFSQYKYLCNMLKVDGNEFDTQWNNIFRKVADLINFNTSKNSQSSNVESPIDKREGILNNQLQNMLEKKDIELNLIKTQNKAALLSAKYGSIIERQNANICKMILDLHISITNQEKSELRPVIFYIIFSKRLAYIMKHKTDFCPKALTSFVGSPKYSMDIIIRDLRNKFTALTLDLELAKQNLKDYIKESSK